MEQLTDFVTTAAPVSLSGDLFAVDEGEGVGKFWVRRKFDGLWEFGTSS